MSKINSLLLLIRKTDWKNIFLVLFLIHMASLCLFFLSGNEGNGNFRALFNYAFVEKLIAASSHSIMDIRKLETFDDVGFSVIYAISNHFFEKANRPTGVIYGHELPIFVQYFFTFFLWFAMGTWTYISSLIIGNVRTLIFGILFFCSPNIIFLAYSFDVYLFPFYGFIFSLFLFIPNASHKIFLPSIFAVLAGICEWFRSSSIYSWILGAVILIFYYGKMKNSKQISKVIYLLILALCIAIIPKIILSNSGHVFYHSLHAGLFSEGGFHLKDGKVLPKFLESTIGIHQINFRFNTWSDKIQYLLAQSENSQMNRYSKEYEQLIKIDYLRIINIDRWKTFQFYLSRIPTLLNFNTYRSLSFDSEFKSTTIDDYLWVSFFLVLFLFTYFSCTFNCIAIYLFLSIIIYSIAPLLVHPQYFMYNVTHVGLMQCFFIFFLGTTPSFREFINSKFLSNNKFWTLLNFKKYFSKIFTHNSQHEELNPSDK